MFFCVPGKWLGSGSILITGSDERIQYYTKWLIGSEEEGVIHALQVVEKAGVEEQIKNHYRFSQITEKTFLVEMENNLIGISSGTGEIFFDRIKWTFSKESPCHGFEEILQIGKEEYQVISEFSSDGFKTVVEGTLWKAL